jgi:hypothetical protein
MLATKAMLKIAIIKLLVSATLIIGSAFPAASAPLTLYSSEEQAQQHCPSDVVVWLNLPTHIYHWKGMRWYGNTNNGAYVCKKEADENGNRGTLNGQ